MNTNNDSNDSSDQTGEWPPADDATTRPAAPTYTTAAQLMHSSSRTERAARRRDFHARRRTIEQTALGIILVWMGIAGAIFMTNLAIWSCRIP